jgi:NAD(P)-dependent dehydrogenase (short-subunit alcohol dehydrogenase family)
MLILFQGDYDVTHTVHSDTYPEIDPANADFSGRAVFVTGASRGLGRAAVLSFTKAGASYIAAGARSDLSHLAKDIAAAAASANRDPPKFLPLQLDVSDSTSVDNAAAAIEREFGRCDVVVNNAGIVSPFTLIGDSDPKLWWGVLDVNLRGPYLVSRALLPLLQKSSKSYIINVSSVGGVLVMPAGSPYQISKMAVIRLTEFLNTEYSEKGVVSFSVHPGNCVTDIIGGADGINPDLKHSTSLSKRFDLMSTDIIFSSQSLLIRLNSMQIHLSSSLPNSGIG